MIIDFPGETRSAHRRANGARSERRRVVVIGADAAGLTVALHIGAHSLLVEQHSQVGAYNMGHEPQGGSDDFKSSFPLGASRTGIIRTENNGADVQQKGISAWERREIVGACGTAREKEAAGLEDEQVEVARWVPPVLNEIKSDSCTADAYSLESLVPLLRGDIRLSTRVVRIAPAARSVELSDGTIIIYDKLVSSVAPVDLMCLLQAELPVRIRSHQGLMYWLAARDIELLDATTQLLLGDVTPFAAGRRVAETIKRSLSQKFRSPADTLVRGEQLFKPRLVPARQYSASAH